MSIASVLSIYLALNGAIVAGALALLIVEKLAPRIAAKSLLQLHYGAAATLLLCIVAQSLLPAGLLPGTGLLSVDSGALADAAAAATPGVSSAVPVRTFDAGSLARLWIATVLVLLASGVLMLVRDAWRLGALLRGSHLIRRAGRVHVRVHDDIPTAFSCWRPGRAHVVLPSYLLRDAQSLRVAVAHELQHHRQRDTSWLHVFAALRVLCAINPFAHWWARAVGRAQEFACDEALVERRRVTPETYARCLVDVAERMRAPHSPSGITSCLIGFGDPNSLRRRMERMLNNPRGPWAVKRMRLCVAGVCAAMTLAAYAGSALAEPKADGTRRTVWPVDGLVLAGFGRHRGIDIAAPVGTAVRAYAAGTVLAVDSTRGCAGRVQIRHDSLIGTYCNLDAVAVAAGQFVETGTVIGAVASPVAGVKAHLHFELSAQTFVDPQSHLPRIAAE